MSQYPISGGGSCAVFQLSRDQVFAQIMEAVETGEVAVCCWVCTRSAKSVVSG